MGAAHRQTALADSPRAMQASLDTLPGLHNHDPMTGKGASVDIGAWLRDVGLGQYEAAFRENEISEKVLPKLTAEDLKELGVNALGHRRNC